MLARRMPWRSQPPAGTPVDWTNPLNKQMVACWEYDGGKSYSDLVYGKHAATWVACSPTKTVTRAGRALDFPRVATTTASGVVAPYTADWCLRDSQAAEYSAYAIFEFNEITAGFNNEADVFRAAGTSHQGLAVVVFPGTKVLRVAIATSSVNGWTAANDVTDSALVDGVPWILGFSYRSGSGLRIFSGPIGGVVRLFTPTGVIPAGYLASSTYPDMYLAGGEYSGTMDKGGIRLQSVRMHKRALSDSEFYRIAENPWQIFQP